MESHVSRPQGSLKSASAFSNAVTTLTSILILSASQPFRTNDEIREEVNGLTMRPFFLKGLLSMLHVGHAGS